MKKFTGRYTTNTAPLARAPFTVQAKKAPAACYYNADADFAAIYDTKFIDALHPAAQLRTTSAISAALAYINDEPFAVVMPIRAEPNAARAIKAFFTEAAEDNTKTGETDNWPRPRKKPPPCAAICTGQPTRSTS